MSTSTLQWEVTILKEEKGKENFVLFKLRGCRFWINCQHLNYYSTQQTYLTLDFVSQAFGDHHQIIHPHSSSSSPIYSPPPLFFFNYLIFPFFFSSSSFCFSHKLKETTSYTNTLLYIRILWPFSFSHNLSFMHAVTPILQLIIF